MEQNIKKEALSYFGKKAFHRLFSLFKQKIESLGTVSGSVKINPTEDEKAAIEAWMGIKIKTVPVSISLSRFEKRLLGSKFEEYTLWTLVELITNEPIIHKKEREQQADEKKQNYFQSLLENFPHPNAQFLIHKILNKAKGTAAFNNSYQNEDFKSIEIILKAISSFPKDGDFERLPVFAERITGDPHYFDKNKRIYQVIELIISEKENRLYRSSLNAEEETELLSSVNLDKDDLHSFVTIVGLEAFQNGEVVQQWHFANKQGTVQNIPLRSLRNIEKVKPLKGDKVFIFENSGVYSSVLDKMSEVYPIICTHGNIKLSGKLLLDKLVENGATLYYSGDLDVNGIIIARNLKRRYRDKLRIWRMDKESYHQSVSKVQLSNTALERLNFDESDVFFEVSNELKKIKKAGYQEPLIPLYLKDIANLVK